MLQGGCFCTKDVPIVFAEVALAVGTWCRGEILHWVLESSDRTTDNTGKGIMGNAYQYAMALCCRAAL